MKRIIDFFFQLAWLYFAIVLLCLFILFLLGSLEEYISAIRTFITALPLVALFLASVSWAARTERQRFIKIMAGIIAGAVSSAMVYYLFLDEIMTWIEDKQETVTDMAMGSILLLSLGLAISASKMNPVTEKKSKHPF